MHKAGLIGAGGISDNHFKGLRETGRAVVEYVWDIDPANVELAVSRWGCQAVGSARQLMECDIDIVVISTPAFARVEYVRMAAEAGKHIYVEKPLALNMEDAGAIREAVDRSGVIFMVGFNLRYEPVPAQLVRVMQSGRIGKTVSAWARIASPTKPGRWQKIMESGHWRASMEKSGGRIVEFGSHAVNWLLWVLGDAKTVYGKAMRITENASVDDADYAIIDCQHGVGLLEIHRHGAAHSEESYGIVGHGGTVVCRDGQLQLIPMDGKAEPLEIEAVDENRHEHFLSCIENRRTPHSSIEDGLETVRVCSAFHRSARSGQVEAVAHDESARAAS